MPDWLITDTHFEHAALINLDGRPSDFTEQIVYNWQALVGQDQVILHLGDFAFAGARRTEELLHSLPGTLVLVRGNHDHRCSWWMKRGVALCVDEMRIGDKLFTHEPREPLPDWCRLNVCGHLHSKPLSELGPYFRQHSHRYHVVNIEKELAPLPYGQLDKL